MSWSQAEISALATKAARGAGAPPEQAARFGQAAAAHLAQGRAASEIDQALRALPEGPILRFGRDIDRVKMAALAMADTCVDVRVDDCAALFDSYLSALPFEVKTTAIEPDHIRVVTGNDRGAACKPVGRISGCDRLIARMSDLAARTFVPESDASRRAGAGAGLTDND